MKDWLMSNKLPRLISSKQTNKMHVHNRKRTVPYISNQVTPDFTHLAVKHKTHTDQQMDIIIYYEYTNTWY